jgi:hypothetical protein
MGGSQTHQSPPTPHNSGASVLTVDTFVMNRGDQRETVLQDDAGRRMFRVVSLWRRPVEVSDEGFQGRKPLFRKRYPFGT